MAEPRDRKRRRTEKLVDDDLTANASDRRTVDEMLGPDFVEAYQKAPLEDRYQVLIEKYAEIWDGTEQRPETIASMIRKALGDAAPRNVIGHPSIPVPVGFTCHYKAQLAVLGLHSSPMMGICSDNGVASAIVVNGGYADDVDRGSIFIYVGEGGEQTGESQSLNRGNLSLLNACERGSPIRVIRGYKAHSRYAPVWGFRYDGLYEISQGFWDMGQQDRRVWKFVMVSLNKSWTPERCGCDDGHLVDHAKSSNEELLLPQFVPVINKKARAVTDKQIKDHQRVQASNFEEPKRLIDVKASQCTFKMNVSQLLAVPDNKPVSPTTSPSRSGRYRLPLFTSFLAGLVEGPTGEWLENVYRRFKLPQHHPDKPLWARAGFLPFVLRLETPSANGSKDRRQRKVLDLPVNKKLAREHALPYFPQSTKDRINMEITLVAPFPDDWDPSRDISQGQEQHQIPCINEIDDTPPPTDFTYVKNSIALSVSPLRLDEFCSGCVPAGIDTSTWVQVKGSGGGCAGLKDPESGKVYCLGRSVKDVANLRGDCGSSCLCDGAFCTNRVFHPGVQYKVAIKRVPELGWGLFALEDIPRNAFVCEYAGDLINFGELKARVHKYEKYGMSNFCFEIFQLDEELTESWKYPCVDSQLFGNVARFVNHSCDPNLFACAHFHDNNEGRCGSLFALRDIKASEQMCYDYGASYTDGLECKCGAAGCRKFISNNSTTNAPENRRGAEVLSGKIANLLPISATTAPAGSPTTSPDPEIRQGGMAVGSRSAT